MTTSITISNALFDKLVTQAVDFNHALNQDDAPHNYMTHNDEDGEMTLLSINDADGNRINLLRASIHTPADA